VTQETNEEPVIDCCIEPWQRSLCRLPYLSLCETVRQK